MILNKIRKGQLGKGLAVYLTLQLLLQIFYPTTIWALTGGPKQPEFNSFTPIGTSDMVDLSSGDFNYNIPIMDVGGYPLNLSYQSGITMDQEASWVGLGWNLNVGQINRNVRGIPDDFKGDKMVYENNVKDNVTVSVDTKLDPQVFGLELQDQLKDKLEFSIGVSAKYNNYTGFSMATTAGIAFDTGKGVSAGLSLRGSASEGTTVSPSVTLKSGLGKILGNAVGGQLNAGLSYNSNQGLSNVNVSAGLSAKNLSSKKARIEDGVGASGSGSISFSMPTMTPRKRLAYRDIAGTVAVSLGPSLKGVDGEIEISAAAYVQKLKDKRREEKSYGYLYTGYAGPEDIIDYNRENDQVINEALKALPVSNYTYDTYSVQAQGIGGMFRPFRNQVGYIYDEHVKDKGETFELGAEIEAATDYHSGVNFTKVDTESSTGVWNTRATNYFQQAREELEEKLGYEPVVFKYVGENVVDNNEEVYNRLGGDAPMRFKLSGVRYHREADSKYELKKYKSQTVSGRRLEGAPFYEDLERITTKIRKNKRELRNQSIQKINKSDLGKYYDLSSFQPSGYTNTYAKDHHIVELRVLKEDGSTYVFGEPAYNVNKQELTFALNNSTQGDCKTGLVDYNPSDASLSNGNGRDHFFDKSVTPAYAHSYLISSILSADYEDLTQNGPTSDDLGSYTRFEYTKPEPNNYNWRVPYQFNKANYNAGLNTNKSDQKGTFIYGTKEIKYIKKIETKTHVALFEIEKRKDAKGVTDINGGGNTNASNNNMYKLKKVSLYSLPEAKAAKILDQDPSNDLYVEPIKEAHFEYSYKLCQGIPNHINANQLNLSEGNGKLTLEKVYFTYRDSHMGKYTPYAFNYDLENNPPYNLKGNDLWGNYKPNTDISGSGCNTTDPLTNAEFPFVEQSNKLLQDNYAKSWSLKSIQLPSGGKIDLDYETDDYQYVQDRDALHMVKVLGVGSTPAPSNSELTETKFYRIADFEKRDNEYLYFEVDSVTTTANFRERYLRGIKDKPIYFRFLINMTRKGARSIKSSHYDYVTGYFEPNNYSVFERIIDGQTKKFAALETKKVKLEGGLLASLGGKTFNPIHKAGLYFARRYLNEQALGITSDYGTDNAETIARKVVGSIGSFLQLLIGPNKNLRLKKLCAQRFVSGKSWIRLSVPTRRKLGGGLRVKSLKMYDQWDQLIGDGASAEYNKEYGQTYEYVLEDGTSSGVATFEANGNKENPFVEPFFNDSDGLLGPKEVNYTEKPFGASFFPSPTITYSRIIVKNLAKDGVKKHATGKVITEYYTSKDFPTKTDYTDINPKIDSNENQILRKLVSGLFGIPIKNRTTMSLTQGFVIKTNDMNGKMKSQRVYQESEDKVSLKPISSVDYVYHINPQKPNELLNKVPVIYDDGQVVSKHIAIDYDVVNDFRNSFSETHTFGTKGNLALLIIGVPPFVIPVPTAFPTNINDTRIANSAITTKVIHTTGILKEKIASDLGATVRTVNTAWDAHTGQVLLTRTENEYNDAYYNLNMPAYWYYKNMGLASKNIGLKGTLKSRNSHFEYLDFKSRPNRSMTISDFFALGDELIAIQDGNRERLWVVGFSGDLLLLMNRLGHVINQSEARIDGDFDFEIVRSGYRNLQTANLSSLTLMKNPIVNTSGNLISNIKESLQVVNTARNLRIVNSSAVTYSDFWNCQCERSLPFIPLDVNDSSRLDTNDLTKLKSNPYLFNIFGEWKAQKSYAYLAERGNVSSSSVGITSPITRKEGFFKQYTPYYRLNNENDWEVSNSNRWTFASEVTQYSPYGTELENRDALGRYSSAQYGYNYTLPTAVASNSQYRLMGVDNMEDYGSFPNFSERFGLTEEDPFTKRFTDDEEHFNFKAAALNDGDEEVPNVRPSNLQSHTGQFSLEVPKNDEAVLVRPLKGQVERIEDDTDGDGIPDSQDNCPYVKNGYRDGGNQSDQDNNGIGDACDDDFIPFILNNETYAFKYTYKGNRREPCHNQRAIFTVQGKPNAKIYYKILNVKTGRRGWYSKINEEKVAEHRSFGDLHSFDLDITGRRQIQFDLIAHRRQKRKDNTTAASFVITDKYGNFVTQPLELHAEGYRKCHSVQYPSSFALEMRLR